MSAFPDSIYIRLGDAKKLTTPSDIGFPSELATIAKKLKAPQLLAWLTGDDKKVAQRATVLSHLVLTDEVWTATRAVIDRIDDLQHAFLPYGVGILGLAAVPRLIEAHDAKGPTKQAKWIYRQAIVCALAVAASSGESWPAAYDRFLAVDEAWWFAKLQMILGNWHNDLQLSKFVMPLLRAAIAGLPKPRAHAILDAALDETGPKKFPMCFLALPLLATHWKPAYLERAIQATRLGEDAMKSGFIDSVIWRQFSDDLSALKLLEKVVLERYKTGHWKHQFELNGIADTEKFFKQAKKALPPKQFPRFEKNYKAMFATD